MGLLLLPLPWLPWLLLPRLLALGAIAAAVRPFAPKVCIGAAGVERLPASPARVGAAPAVQLVASSVLLDGGPAPGAGHGAVVQVDLVGGGGGTAGELGRLPALGAHVARGEVLSRIQGDHVPAARREALHLQCKRAMVHL